MELERRPHDVDDVSKQDRERERDSFKMELRPTTGNVTSESTSTNKINSKHR